jgi:hypothetical protein
MTAINVYFAKQLFVISKHLLENPWPKAMAETPVVLCEAPGGFAGRELWV